MSKKTEAGRDLLEKIDFSDDEYKVKQRIFRNKYTVYDSDGEEILKAKQKLLKMKEEFPFKTPDGDVVFRVKAKNTLDIAGDYTVVDEETGEEVLVLEKEFSILIHRWRIRDPNTGDEIAEIESRSKIFGLLRYFSNIASYIPHRYSIEEPDGRQVGEIRGKLSIRDTYVVDVEDDDIPKEAVVPAAIVVDALEGN
ncbi:MAG: hypothetical protein SV760_06875 [Halobacteria archaeon]|nr:hypothetical protein [Halobacteria archaeon]